jgi:hypothetical protein
MNPPPFVRCRWCSKRLVRQALRAHQLLRCPVRALRAHVHATARSLGLAHRGPSELDRCLEQLAEPDVRAPEWMKLPGGGGKMKRALQQE